MCAASVIGLLREDMCQEDMCQQPENSSRSSSERWRRPLSYLPSPKPPSRRRMRAVPEPPARLRAELRAGHGGPGPPRHRPVRAGSRHLSVEALAATGSDRPLSTTEPAGYGATDLETAYHLPANRVGEHGTIAILDAGCLPGAGIRPQHLPRAVRSACVHDGQRLPEDHRLHGGPPLAPDPTQPGQEEESVAIETSLDVDMASAACPLCHIIEVQLPTGTPSRQTQAEAGRGDGGLRHGREHRGVVGRQRGQHELRVPDGRLHRHRRARAGPCPPWRGHSRVLR